MTAMRAPSTRDEATSGEMFCAERRFKMVQVGRTEKCMSDSNMCVAGLGAQRRGGAGTGYPCLNQSGAATAVCGEHPLHGRLGWGMSAQEAQRLVRLGPRG